LLGDLASVIRSIDHIQTVAARDPFLGLGSKSAVAQAGSSSSRVPGRPAKAS